MAKQNGPGPSAADHSILETIPANSNVVFAPISGEEPQAARDARENRHKYFMNIALAVRLRANCKGKRVGAIIVLDNRIISTGYNGTPENMVNCLDGGCY